MRHLALLAASLAVACATPRAASSAPAATYTAMPIDARNFLAGPPHDDDADLAAVKRAQAAARGTERWAAAQHDDDSSPFSAFGPVLGAAFTAERAPKTAALFKTLFDDASKQTRPAKDAFARKRPPLVDNAIETCAPLETTPSYPSGHATRGWLMALVLAEMVPEKADAILARGRDYGDSRVVCGEHFPSDVEAGREIGAALFASAKSSPVFARDFDAARAEVRGALGLAP